VSFIDNNLKDIYRQSAFHKLPQTQHTPFHRGPHRLTKLSEAAATHATTLKNQDITGLSQKRILTVRKRVPPPIVYDESQFPPLDHIKRQSPGPSQSNVATASKLQTTDLTQIQDQLRTLTSKFSELEQQVEKQQEQLTQLTQTVTTQQTSINKLTSLIEAQHATTTTLQEAVIKLTENVTHLKELNTTFVHSQQRTSPSPEREQITKRLKTHEDHSSPAHLFRPVGDEDMAETENWEQDHPNMSTNHRSSPSPSL